MHEVIPKLLWIGNALDARNPGVIFDTGIVAIVDVAYEEKPADLPRSLVYCRFPLTDGAGNEPRFVRLAVDTVTSFLSAQIPTLVACSAGMSRSPVIAAMALSRHRNESLETALESITRERPHDVSPAFWHDVIAACRDNDSNELR